MMEDILGIDTLNKGLTRYLTNEYVLLHSNEFETKVIHLLIHIGLTGMVKKMNSGRPCKTKPMKIK